MRMVKEPVMIRNNWGNVNPVGQRQNSIVLSRSPLSTFIPPHLKYLADRCFSAVKDSHRFILCPFQNITQQEVAISWNPYRVRICKLKKKQCTIVIYGKKSTELNSKHSKKQLRHRI